MDLSYKARRRLSLLILVVGLPLYIIVAVNIIALFERPPFLLEIVVYVVLGIAWALPLKFVFLGVSRDDPGRDGSDTPPK